MFGEGEAREKVRLEKDRASGRFGVSVAGGADGGTRAVFRGPAPRGPRARDKIRLLNKRVLNPTMMTLAGRRHFYAAVLRHRGRRSGREYATPVVAVPVAGDAFVVPLPYGEEVDWLKNVLAAGRATMEARGETHEVAEPEVIDAAEAFPLLDERHRRTWRRFGIERFLRAKAVRRDP